MRIALAFVATALCAVACGGGGGELAIDSIDPPYAPVAGGTRVVILGEGFNSAPNRVVFGNREAPLAQAISDGELEVVVPEGDVAGDVDVLVINSGGYTTASGQFHYSDLPTVGSVTPAKVPYDVGGAVTLTGSGFQAEGAGPVTVLLNGRPAIDVAVVDDTSLTFTALPGQVFDRPDITVINARGEALDPDAFQYGPGPSGGFILWTRQLSDTFAAFVDPVSLALIRVPRVERGGGGGSGLPVYHAVLQNTDGTFIAQDSSTDPFTGQRSNKLHTFAIDTQDVTVGAQLPFRVSEMVRVASTVYVIDRQNSRFGTIDLSNLQFTQLGSGNITSGGPKALATDASGNTFIVQATGGTVQLSAISRSTGALGTPVTITATPPNPHITGMSFLNGTLYAVTRDGTLLSINMSTGEATVVLPTGLNVVSMTAVQ